MSRGKMFAIKAAILLVLSIAVVEVFSRETDYCYADNDQPYLKFATKTAYHFIHGGKTRYQTIPNCKPLQIWMLMRYGTRSPSRDEIPQMMTLPKLRDQIIYNHENRGHGRLCDRDLDALKQWRLDPNLRSESAESISRQGVEDLNLLAGRTKSNFPDLFPPVVADVNSRNYEFRSADGDPTMASIRAFASGLFDRYQVPQIQDASNDTLFASQQDCPRWQSEVGSSPDLLAEANNFSQSPEYQDVVYNVSQRLGFLYNISAASVNVMYDMCRYDKSWQVGSVSPWCSVFSDEELRVLEYREDLVEYYKRGYGHESNLQLGCPLVKDMFSRFQKLEGGKSSEEPKGVFYVSKLDGLESFLSAMGFAKDRTPLDARNYRSMNKRQWKTSEIGSFAANIAAVFYQCEGSRSRNKVMFYLAEKPVSYEGCNVGLCDWEYLTSKFEKTLSECGKDFCSTSGAVLSSLATISILVPAIAFFGRL